MDPTLSRSIAAALAIGAATLAIPSSAAAFGTVDFNGQHAEHEQITRVLSCEAVDRPDRCFEPRSIDELAGKKGTLGGVGSPDRVPDVLLDGAAHCDAGDYLPGFPYSSADAGRAAKEIADCVAEFGRHLDEALAAAGGFLDERGQLVPQQAAMSEGLSDHTCTYPMSVSNYPGNESAKCRVFNGLGRALHAAEDFWSHSNWADQADPTRPTMLTPGSIQFGGAGWQKVMIAPPNAKDPVYSISNPSGLGRTDVVPFLRYPVPSGLIPTAATVADGAAAITGCDDSLVETTKVMAPGECAPRVGHSVLNKDKGIIDPKTGRTNDPETSRGKIADNFQRAVTGARAQAKAVWGDFAAQVLVRYGAERGERILTALTTDTPWSACKVADGSSAKGYGPPSGTKSALRSVTARVVNQTNETLACDAVSLASGEWASWPADQVAPKSAPAFRVESTVVNGTIGSMGGPEGSVSYRLGTTGYGVRFTWDNPIVGSNKFTCQVTRNGSPDGSAPYRCVVENQRGNDATPSFVVAGR